MNIPVVANIKALLAGGWYEPVDGSCDLFSEPNDPETYPAAVDLFGPVLPSGLFELDFVRIYRIEGLGAYEESDWADMLNLPRLLWRTIDLGDGVRTGNWGAIVAAGQLAEGQNCFVGTFNEADEPFQVLCVDRNGPNIHWQWSIGIHPVVSEDPLHTVNQ